MRKTRDVPPPEQRQTQDQNQRAAQHALQSQRKGSATGGRAESGTRKGRPASAPYDPHPDTLGRKSGAAEHDSNKSHADRPERSSDTT
jgi:hypothetical protein